MKPYLQVLLVAVPLLVSNILACEGTDSTEVAPRKSETVAAPSAPARPSTSIPAASDPAAKPVPTSRSIPAHARSWFM
ncbi:MAG: hypothetical protein JWM35_421 [Verrucomicrobia bacterium]|nr:hypothetical protein [Verrucomicrobiota bacterium]